MMIRQSYVTIIAADAASAMRVAIVRGSSASVAGGEARGVRWRDAAARKEDAPRCEATMMAGR